MADKMLAAAFALWLLGGVAFVGWFGEEPRPRNATGTNGPGDSIRLKSPNCPHISARQTPLFLCQRYLSGSPCKSVPGCIVFTGPRV